MSSSDNEHPDPNGHPTSPLFHGVSSAEYVAAMKTALATDPALQAKNRKLAAEVSAAIDAKLPTMQQSNLKCVQCRLDATVPLRQQAKTYTRSKLDEHLRSNFHDRREQVKRLFRLDKNDVGTFKCPCCSANHPKWWREEECLAHMESEHEVEMKS